MRDKLIYFRLQMCCEYTDNVQIKKIKKSGNDIIGRAIK